MLEKISSVSCFGQLCFYFECEHAENCVNRKNSIIDNIPGIMVGDHIDKINGITMVGRRHYDVAKILADFPRGSRFTIRLVEPLKCGFGKYSDKMCVCF